MLHRSQVRLVHDALIAEDRRLELVAQHEPSYVCGRGLRPCIY